MLYLNTGDELQKLIAGLLKDVFPGILYWCDKRSEKGNLAHLSLLYSLLFSETMQTVSYKLFSLFATLNLQLPC